MFSGESPGSEELTTFGDSTRPRYEDPLHAELRALRAEVAALRSRQIQEPSADDSGDTSLHKFWHRAGWLVMLLMFQSTSSIILERFELLIKTHPVVIYFLTMLVGAGGNAGGQSTVLVVRQLALDALRAGRDEKRRAEDSCWRLVSAQIWVGARLAVVLFGASFFRCVIFKTEWVECWAICISMLCIVFTSTLIGAALPLLLKKMRVDPAHAGAAIQVVMDISGVSLTCIVSCLVLGVPVMGSSLSKVESPSLGSHIVQGSRKPLHSAGEG